MNLIDVTKEFATEESCLVYLESLRWPDGVRCVKCDSKKISRITRRSRKENKRTKLYQCLECGQQFTATSGTIFHDSHLPLSKWFMAVALMLNAKKGLSACQLQRDLGIGSYRTAWYLAHRIRKAMEEGQLPKFTGIVEADETYMGGRYDRRRKRNPWEKLAVMGFAERGGRVEAFPIATPSATVLVGKIKDRISSNAELVVTDQLQGYKGVGKTHRHAVINHIREYVRGSIHTNTIENFWSLFKRGVLGQFHKVSAKHLHRYPAEFTYRHNRREFCEVFASTLAAMLIRAGMTYQSLVSSD